MATVGDRLAQARGYALLSQQELADLTTDLGESVSRATIARIEAGTVWPQRATLRRLAKVLAISARWRATGGGGPGAGRPSRLR